MPRAIRLLRLSRIALALLLLGQAWSSPVDAKPVRIVSINVCTDQLLLQLADRSSIASLSALALDPRSSTMTEQTDGIPTNNGLAEEVIAHTPDLVLASGFSSRPTLDLLRRLGYAVFTMPVATDLEAVRQNVREVARAVGEEERGARLIEAFDARIAAARPAPESPRPLAALFWANAYTSGRGTLTGAIVEAAGFRSLGSESGLTGIAPLPLEALIVARPRVLITGTKRGGRAQGEEILSHLALVRTIGPARRIAIPDAFWLCGTPKLADAMDRLARLRRSLGAGVGR